MRIIDKTSLQDEAGNISPVARIQGTLKYGLNWYAELEAQKVVIEQFDRMIEKSFVLIRNFTLPDSEIVIPIILIGTGSISVILVTPVKGHFEAAGGEWNEVVNNSSIAPAKRNLIELVSRLAKAFEKYLEKQGISVDVPIEPVLIASNPGAQIDSLRPNVRILRSDAIKQFASSLLQERPVIQPNSIYALADKIIEPTPPIDENASQPQERPVSRAQAIFNASNQSGATPARPLPKPTQKKSRGLNRTQITLIVAMTIIECCVIGVGAYIIFFLS